MHEIYALGGKTCSNCCKRRNNNGLSFLFTRKTHPTFSSTVQIISPQNNEPFRLKMSLCKNKNSQGQIVNNVPSSNKNISAGSNFECVYTVTPNLQNICYGRPDPEDCVSKTVLLFKNLDWIIQRKSKVSGHPV